MALQALAQVAVDAVVKASRVCEAVRTGGLLQAIDKADKSPVTVADYAAQVRLSERERERERSKVCFFSFLLSHSRLSRIAPWLTYLGGCHC